MSFDKIVTLYMLSPYNIRYICLYIFRARGKGEYLKIRKKVKKTTNKF